MKKMLIIGVVITVMVVIGLWGIGAYKVHHLSSQKNKIGQWYQRHNYLYTVVRKKVSNWDTYFLFEVTKNRMTVFSMVKREDFLKKFPKEELSSRLTLEGFVNTPLVSHTHAFAGKIGSEEVLTINDNIEVKFLNGEELLTFRDKSRILSILDKLKTADKIEFKNALGSGVSLVFKMNDFEHALEKFKKVAL